ncbi:inactive protein RESTRICTED TEV MOVEMENT 2-like [Phoenix dactylifera]|uniref:Inactive protein RESTRICTED TEV MOVEMENT 2-like n=1 Tax=Phoenix dactylifera TaxID=42345 RepID=A0A8B7D3X5_PHODC|nr:inactive protein RESTRICTED TEV MOVEMENT 2-like [Phoenix dactylifera]
MPLACKPTSTLVCSRLQMACTQSCTFFQPATQWTQDPDKHILRVCLPGFQKDEIKVQVDCCGKLTIRGGRPLGDGKYMRLEQVFAVPKDSHVDKIRGKFEEAHLCLFMPKKVVSEKQEPQRAASCEKKQVEAPPEKPSSSLVGADRLEECKKKAGAWKLRIAENVEGWLDYGLIDGLLETISKNKKAIAVGAAAFSVGFYVSGKLRSSGR